VTHSIAGVEFGGPVARLKYITNGIVVGVPTLGAGLAIWHAYNYGITLATVLVFVPFYLWTVLGASLGLHRYYTHRSFKASPALRIFLGMGACFALQGPIVRWVANHRRHHRLEDRAGDPHSPLVDPRGAELTQLRGLWHAHFGWLFDDSTSNPQLFCPDIFTDRYVAHFEDFYWGYVALAFALPWAIGLWLGGTIEGVRCLLWAGCFSPMLVQQLTFGISSIGHKFGPQDFRTGNSSRNLWPVSLLLLGEGYHNNHHAFPGSATTAFRKTEFDPGIGILRFLEKLGAVRDIVMVAPELIEARRKAGTLTERQGGCTDSYTA
jgi:stearoyl-CoA desaturase (Delta-9 desaturase)